MRDRLSELMLLGLVLWTALGLVGVMTARVRGERARFRRGLLTLGGVWLGYGVLLVGVSVAERGRVVPAGGERCFRPMCFAVEGVDELQGYPVRGEDRSRLVRVRLRVRNVDRSGSGSEPGLVVSLVDGQGRQWRPLAGLGGVRLTSIVPAGGGLVSEPVFRLPPDAGDLRLLLGHRQWTAARLEIGNAESLFHRPAEMALPREKTVVPATAP